jgi:predicted DNA-binding protein
LYLYIDYKYDCGNLAQSICYEDICMSIRENLEKAFFDQTDESSSVPLSIRLPIHLSNELDELSLTLDKSKSFLLLELIKAGVIETNKLLEEKAANPKIHTDRQDQGSLKNKKFMLNTNYNNDKDTHFQMLENQEAAAFCKGWREYICNLSEGDKVYLYQSGVGFVASGIVTGSLEKSEYDGKAEDKYSKKLKDFKFGFRAVTAKEFKVLTGAGANFRMTMVEVTPSQAHKLDSEIEKRMKSITL